MLIESLSSGTLAQSEKYFLFLFESLEDALRAHMEPTPISPSNLTVPYCFDNKIDAEAWRCWWENNLKTGVDLIPPRVPFLVLDTASINKAGLDMAFFAKILVEEYTGWIILLHFMRISPISA